MKTRILFLCICCSFACAASSQTASGDAGRCPVVEQVKKEWKDSSKAGEDVRHRPFPNPLKVSGYIETYYSYDAADPADHRRQPFMYSFNRHNEVNLNLAFIKLAYETDKLRAGVAVMAGTYAQDNLAAEPGVLKNVLEAGAGVRLSAKKNVWVDAGVFSSHIGFESAVGKDCWNLTRSLMAENSPYYETGVKVSYTSDNEKWFVSGLLLNGWQRIYRPDGNQTPAFGHQVTYKPNARVTLNSSSFIGNDKADSVKKMRYFHNLYGIFRVHAKWGLILGFDIGAEQKTKGGPGYDTWWSPVMVVRYAPVAKLGIAVRAEYYSDKYGVMIATGTPGGFQTAGYSLNLDYAVAGNLVWRIEGRGFRSKDPVFRWADRPSVHNFFVTTSLAVSF